MKLPFIFKGECSGIITGKGNQRRNIMEKQQEKTVESLILSIWKCPLACESDGDTGRKKRLEFLNSLATSDIHSKLAYILVRNLPGFKEIVLESLEKYALVSPLGLGSKVLNIFTVIRDTLLAFYPNIFTYDRFWCLWYEHSISEIEKDCCSSPNFALIKTFHRNFALEVIRELFPNRYIVISNDYNICYCYLVIEERDSDVSDRLLRIRDALHDYAVNTLIKGGVPIPSDINLDSGTWIHDLFSLNGEAWKRRYSKFAILLASFARNKHGFFMDSEVFQIPIFHRGRGGGEEPYWITNLEW